MFDLLVYLPLTIRVSLRTQFTHIYQIRSHLFHSEVMDAAVSVSYLKVSPPHLQGRQCKHGT